MDYPKRSEIKVGTVAWRTSDGTDAVVTQVWELHGLVQSFAVRVLAPKTRKLSPTMQNAVDEAARGTHQNDRAVFGRCATLGALFGAGKTEIVLAYDSPHSRLPSSEGRTHRLPIDGAVSFK